MTRKRRREMKVPVLFVTERRMRSVPCGAHVSGDGLRSRLGGAACEAEGEVRPKEIVSSWLTGLEVFFGPGAPRTGDGLSPTFVCGVVETSTKSAALLSVSCTPPVKGCLRVKAYWLALSRVFGSGVPSVRRSQVSPDPLLKPTASRRCKSSNRFESKVLKRPMPTSPLMEPVSDWSGTALVFGARLEPSPAGYAPRL